MPYADFVGLINQWNVLPGAYNTLSKWAVYGRIDKTSRILEVACTTGFSSRELSIMTGCKGVGFDVSKLAVSRARYNQKKYAKTNRISYLHADGKLFNAEGKFSHIIVGASLKFFSNPEIILKKCNQWLLDGGYLLASPFYTTRAIPDQLLKKARSVFGITPTTATYKEILASYRNYEIIFEEQNTITQETPEEIADYCDATVTRACDMLKIQDARVRNALYNRIHAVRAMSNELRPYQKYVVLVLRYRRSTYPYRYVELF